MRIDQSLLELLGAAARGRLQGHGSQGASTAGGGFEGFLQAGGGPGPTNHNSGQGHQPRGSSAPPQAATNPTPAQRRSQGEPVPRQQSEVVVREGASNTTSQQTPDNATGVTGQPSTGEQGAAVSETVSSEAPQEAAEGTVVQQVPEVDVDVAAAYQALLVEIARILGIEVQELAQALQDLGIEVQELAQPQNLGLLLQAVWDQGPVELLNVPGISQVFAEVGDAIDMFVKAEHAAQQALLPHNHTASVAANANPIVEQVQVEVQAAAIVEPEDVQEVLQVPPDEVTGSAEQATTTAGQQGGGDAANTGGNMPQAHQDATGVVAGPQAQAPEQVRVEVGQTPEGGVVVREVTTAGQVRTVSVAVPSPQADVNPAEVVRQIVDRMKLDLGGGLVNELRMTLRPESLGELTMRIVTLNGIVTAHFVAESTRVKEIMDAQMAELRHALEEQGIEVSELSVSVDTRPDERMRQLEYQQGQASVRMAADQDEGQEAEAPPASPILHGNTVEFSA